MATIPRAVVGKEAASCFHHPNGFEGDGKASRREALESAEGVCYAVKMNPDVRYEIILYWSQEDQAFLAEVPELAGCAADGPTYQEALANAEVVIQEWLETARELSRPIPAPRGRLMYA